MPPKINLQRAHVTPEFIDLMCAMYGEWMQKNERLIRRGAKELSYTQITSASQNQQSFAHYAHTANRMIPIVRRISNDRVGLDYEVSRLRALPYIKFTVVEDVDPTWHAPHSYDDEEECRVYDYSGAPRIPWLLGRTRFVVMTNYLDRNQIMGQMGGYDVYIPSSIVRTPEIDHVHLIPHRNQYSKVRHPHHYLAVDEDEEITRTPLSYPTGNCYGDFAGVIKGMVDEPDIPQLFNQLYKHLSTYGNYPPKHMDELDFDHETPERK